MTVHHLRAGTIAYLLIPNLLFLIFWVQPLYSLPCLAGLVLLAVIAARQKGISTETHWSFSGRRLLGVAGVSVALVIICGVGGFTCQVPDYWAHNAKFNDLIRHPWPLRFVSNPQYVCYYFGYYLPVAGLARWLGHEQALSVLWAGLGMGLILLWLYVLLERRSWWPVALVVFFGGPYNLYSLYRLIRDYAEGGVFNGHMLETVDAFSNSLFIHNSFIRSLLWVPNQIIPALLATSFFMYETVRRKHYFGSLLVVALLLYWAPFPAMTLAAVAGLTFVSQRAFRQWLRQPVSVAMVAGLTVCLLPLMLYFLCSGGTAIRGFIWKFEEHWLRSYGLIVLGDVLLFTLIISWIRPRSSYRPFLLPATVVLLLLPLYRIGLYNDLHGRGESTASFVLSVLFVQCLWPVGGASIHRWRPALWGLYALGALVPVLQVVRGVGNNRLRTGCRPLVNERLVDLHQALQYTDSLWKEADIGIGARQYECADDCFFVENLMRKPAVSAEQTGANRR